MKQVLVFCLIVPFIFSSSSAQESAVDVLSQFSKVLNGLHVRYVQYQSELAHSDNPRRAEKKRNALLEEVVTARQALAGIPYYKADKGLHQGVAQYLKLLDYNLNEDYSKLVNMKEIAENSYDKMEAYINMKEKIEEKMQAASDSMISAQNMFAKRHNIQLLQKESELDKQLKKISSVSDYYNDIFLVYFKAQLQDENLLEAMNAKSVNKMEQARNALKAYAEEGLAVLDTFKAFNGDATLINGCKRALRFFATEADKTQVATDYFTQEESFRRLKGQFDGDRSLQRDKAAVDKYNASVKAMNETLAQFNKNNNDLNAGRKEAYEAWGNAVKSFFDRQIPVAE